MTSPDEIVAMLRARDEEGLRLLFVQYGGALNGVIERIVGDRRVAEEVLQDTLVRVWTKVDHYDPAQAGLFAWMLGIARHAALDRVRLRGYHEMRKSESFEAPVHGSEITLTSTAAIDVAALTEGLDAKYLEVLEKMYFEGHSASSAAEALGLPVGTVKTRIRKALQLLRTKIAAEKRLPPGGSMLPLLLTAMALVP